MIKKIYTPVLVCLLLCFSMSAFARSFPQYACGKVVDSYTRELMKEFQADLLRPDSTLIKSYFAIKGTSFNQPMNLSIDSLPESDCIIYVTAEGYYPQYMKVKQPGKNEWGIELYPIMMNRIPFYKPKQLEEVTVTASKLKMVMKGDTIVYNADAFALAQGSMLDGLISQLPGVELKGNGQIFVNGKFVNELLVNGESFFKGDPKIALENLPAYMVNDVQVYRRNDYAERIPIEKLPLVMDVKLKKQYQTGWIANAEAGYGTSDRYLGRLFGLMFTRDSRLSIVANANNTNDDRKPGQTDSWNPNWQTAGRADIVKAGIDYLWNSRLRSWKVETNIMAEHKRGDMQSEQISERYLDGGNLFGLAKNGSVSRQWKISTDDKVSFHIPRLWIDLTPRASFIREKADNIAVSSTTDAFGNLLNSLDQMSDTYRRHWTAGTDLYARWNLPQSTNRIDNNFSLFWNDRHIETQTERSLIFPKETESNTHQKLQELLPEQKITVNEKIQFHGDIYTKNPRYHPSYDVQYTFSHSNLNSTRNYFEETDIDLPSTTARNLTLIPSKSFHYVAVNNTHSVEAEMNNFLPSVKWLYQKFFNIYSVSLKVNYAPGHINYHYRGDILHAKRAPWYFEPKVKFRIKMLDFTYKYEARLCNMLDLIDITDSANPLFIYAGNPNLKNTRIHSLNLFIWRFLFKDIYIDAAFHKYENMVAQSAFYDTTTGVTTYMPVNINGNWDITADINAPGFKLDSQKKWQISSNTHFGYQNSVDIINLEQSTVRNLSVREKLSLTYNIMDGMEIAAKGNVDYRHVTSPRADFATIDAFDFDYGIIFRAVKLPWDMSFTTDLMMHSRRGFADSRLNTNDLVWNARLAKSILSGNLTFAIDGYDILGQLSNVQLTMNSQGRTEARYNTLPRYAMLHVIYRLNIQPKKK